MTFERKQIDFGCILNHTEVTRYLTVTNDSPMPVRYRWSFLEDAEKPSVVFHRVPRQRTPDVEVIEFDDAEEEAPVTQAMSESGAATGEEIPDAEEKDFGTEKEASACPVATPQPEEERASEVSF